MIYDGPWDILKMTNLVARKAYSVCRGQKFRCGPKAKPVDFKNYYGKGIRVEYSYKQFVNWFMSEYEKWPYKDDIIVGRIDHNKNYSLDNIRFETTNESWAEFYNRTERSPFKSKSHKVVFLSKNGIQTFSSKRMAAKSIGVDHIRLYWLLRKRSCGVVDESEIKLLRRPLYSR